MSLPPTDPYNEVRDVQLTSGEVAERLGIARSTWSAYVARGQAPAPDGRYDQRTPFWLESTVEDWHAQRPKANG